MNKPSYILLIVSDSLQSANLKTLIQNFGSEVQAVERYNEGVKIINETAPSLVMIDSGLQGLHWSAAASKIKEVNRDIPIFLLTPAIGREESSNIEINGFIKTPVNSVELRDKITRYLQKGNDDCTSLIKVSRLYVIMPGIVTRAGGCGKKEHSRLFCSPSPKMTSPIIRKSAGQHGQD